MLSGSQKIRFKSLSTRAPGSHLISMNFSSQRVYPKTQTDKLASVGYFRGEVDHLSVFFFGFHQGNCIKKNKIYKSLNAKVFNRLL